jgi:hypothetical protein
MLLKLVGCEGGQWEHWALCLKKLGEEEGSGREPKEAALHCLGWGLHPILADLSCWVHSPSVVPGVSGYAFPFPSCSES